MKSVSERGFTLIELMITMVVVVLVLLGFMGANTSIQQASEATHQRTIALQDANRVIETIRNTAASGTFPGNVTAAYPNNGAVAGFSNLTNEAITVSYVNTGVNPLDVTVTVSWSERGVRNVSTQLRTLVTQRS